ncbi:MAG: VWA domain-containing protein [Verrucomicrobiae bacterium]|nr:VWA domain-containing protein [Verrucomicrobiae bacterium]NNJ44376.1 VWA domain-containing protein [Akkermansiaceae bacterium]
MKRRNVVRIFAGTVVAGALSPHDVIARCGSHGGHHHWHPPIMPHVRPRPHHPAPVQVRSVDADIHIIGRVATTTLTMVLHNPGHRQQESEVIIPVSTKATIRQFGLEGAQGKFPAKLIPRDEARRIYDEIVRRSLDPALLEFAGSGLVKSSVFPVPARGSCQIRLVYEELLDIDGNRIDYTLLRTESPQYHVPWNITVDWTIKGGHAGVYSPSHAIHERRIGPNRIKLRNQGVMQAGPLRLSATARQNNHATASIMAYPDARQGHHTSGKGGYFLLLLSPPAVVDQQAVRREVTVVIDKSGSMAGKKMDQVLKASSQIIEGLDDGEAFNIIVYNESVETFSQEPVIKNRQSLLAARKYLSRVRVSGGTNIHDALQTAIGQKPTRGTLPIVLFLTDGVPTIGQTQEKKIREAIAAGNYHHRRIFTFGVGVDVNTPLLSRLADDSRARAMYVLPNEDVELKVAHVFRRLSGPVLSEPELIATDAEGNPRPGSVSDVLPARMPDMFDGEQLVVLGRYHQKNRLHFLLMGRDQHGPRKFQFNLSLKKARKGNAHVPRLWATRKIAVLTEALRDLGSENGKAVNMQDPKIRELVDEIVRLSTEHGVLTEYTAFLARDGMMFTHDMHREAVTRASAEIKKKAVEKRSGAASVNQDRNIGASKSARQLNRSNAFLDERLKESQVDQVCQVADKAFYRKGDEWVDAGLAGKDIAATQALRVNVSSPEFQRIVSRLVTDNRQSCLALGENIRIVIDHQTYLIQSGK